MSKEIWKLVDGFDSKYEVSNLGRVRTWYNRRLDKLKTPRVIKSRKNRYGYLKIALWLHSKSYHFVIHRLVASAFVPNPNSEKLVHHKDCDKTNNTVQNLEWISPKNNQLKRENYFFVRNSKSHRMQLKNQDSDKLQEQDILSEIWKPVSITDGRYEVSTLGRVRRIYQQMFNSKEITTIKPRLVGYEKKGYRGFAFITSSKKRKAVLIHQVVAMEFLKNPMSHKQVNHKDANKHNNRVTNLEWCTAKENGQHASMIGRKSRGEAHWCAKLSEHDVRWIRSQKGILSLAKISKNKRISIAAASGIIRGKSWNWLR